MNLTGKIYTPDVIRGKSAYETAVSCGFDGSEAEWLLTLKGEKGDKGETGDTGPAGHTPERGVDYFTESDKSEMISLLLSSLPIAEEVSL